MTAAIDGPQATIQETRATDAVIDESLQFIANSVPPISAVPRQFNRLMSCILQEEKNKIK
jgi:hypothetical protein